MLHLQLDIDMSHSRLREEGKLVTFPQHELSMDNSGNIKLRITKITVNVADDLPYFLKTRSIRKKLDPGECEKCFTFYEDKGTDIFSHVCHGYASMASALEAQVALLLSALATTDAGSITLIVPQKIDPRVIELIPTLSKFSISGECIDRVKSIMRFPFKEVFAKLAKHKKQIVDIFDADPINILMEEYHAGMRHVSECPNHKCKPDVCIRCQKFVKTQDANFILRSNCISRFCILLARINAKLVKFINSM